MRSFRIVGRYSGNENDLPQREHPKNSVPFREPQDMKKFATVANGLSLGILAVTIVIFLVRLKWSFLSLFGLQTCLGALAAVAAMVPHEFLHGLCMKGDVRMYENLKQGLLFVISTDDMSKARFILVSLCPNLVFGFLPFLLFLIRPAWIFCGILGLFSICAGAGDYINVFNCAVQVPNGAVTYMSGTHSYWYRPEG